MALCIHCGGELGQGNRLCPSCGYEQPEAANHTPTGAPRNLVPRRCPRCGEPAQPEYRFCLHCATSLRTTCPSCGQENPTWAIFCAQCAHPLPQLEIQTSGSQAPEDLPASFPPGSLSGVPGAAQRKLGHLPTKPDLTGRLLGTLRARIIAAVLVVAVLAAGGAAALIATWGHTNSTQAGRVTAFSTLSDLALGGGITAGPDGNVWFTEAGDQFRVNGAGMIGRITPNGLITEFPLATSNSSPSGITSGPDGNLWFTECTLPLGIGACRADQIGRMTPNGQIKEFPLPDPVSDAPDTEIIAGPDGNLWFIADGQIESITPGGQITRFSNADPYDAEAAQVTEIIKGPDGNLWFTDNTSSQIGRMTPSGQITEFPLPNANFNDSFFVPVGIAAGPDDNLWFTECDSYGQGGCKIGRITPQGKVTEFPLPASSAFNEAGSIIAGPDGNLWFTGCARSQDPCNDQIGRITPGGKITDFSVPSSDGPIQAITAGPDGNLWFITNTQIWRITSGV